tara:strand:- start:953 stop:1612 length:660 start_codon:yes stop_codon:yes gene_type:complete
LINLDRQSGIIPTELIKNISIAIVGAGAIGSHTAEILCKMGIQKLRIYDFDTVEEHNLANQGYYLHEIGYKKCEALRERLSLGTGAEIIAECRKFEKDEEIKEDYVISAVDNMSSRSDIWKSFFRSDNPRYFLDGRMGAREGSAYFVDKTQPSTIGRYNKSLFPDNEAVQLPCTEKSTIFCAYGISSIIGALIAKSITGDEMNYSVDLDLTNLHVNRVV